MPLTSVMFHHDMLTSASSIRRIRRPRSDMVLVKLDHEGG
jgi:hypothetical protein